MKNMEKDFTYSFIIPHKNSPDLLQRCVDSIPVRDDVQIIVVDDNSDGEKKPELPERKGLEIVLLNASQSKGAGRARNVGLEHAKGKWLLFADADDYYTEFFLDVLDNYKNEDADVVYFNAVKLHFSGRVLTSALNSVIEKYDGSKDMTDFLKYRVHSPWDKMTKKSFIDRYNIVFEEIANGNDVMFSFLVGYFARNIKVIPNKLYVYTMNRKSITHVKRTTPRLLCYLCNRKKQITFCEFIGHKEWGKDIDTKSYFVGLFKRLYWLEAIHALYVYFKYNDTIRESRNTYIDVVSERMAQ
jgi:glycosyltransferase involved in cell wall biosynthesis